MLPFGLSPTILAFHPYTDDENLDKLAGEDVEEPDKEDQDSYESD